MLEPVQPFANAAAAGVTVEGTRVAASANAAEVEEYRRQCEELLNTEGGEETLPASAAAAAVSIGCTAQLALRLSLRRWHE